MPATFVLVHGAYHGGWCWSRVTGRLRAAGHAVHVLTHTGSGERAHLRSNTLTLDTYVQDALALLEAENLRDVVMVGHSYGGETISGLAERQPQRLRHLVYLDAILPRTGVSMLSTMLTPCLLYTSPSPRDRG